MINTGLIPLEFSTKLNLIKIQIFPGRWVQSIINQNSIQMQCKLKKLTIEGIQVNVKWTFALKYELQLSHFDLNASNLLLNLESIWSFINFDIFEYY